MTTEPLERYPLLKIKERYPLHYFVWDKDKDGLEKFIKEKAADGTLDLEQKDVHGRTPLMLAVTLFYKKIALVLLEHKADVTATDKDGFSVWHEALTTQDYELIKVVYRHREFRRVKNLLRSFYFKYDKFSTSQPFEFNLQYKYTTWVPLPSTISPEDTVYIRKRGNQVTIGYTLGNIDHSGPVPKFTHSKSALCIQLSESEITTWKVDANMNVTDKMVYSNKSDDELLKAITVQDNDIVRKMKEPVRVDWINSDKLKLKEVKSRWSKSTKGVEIGSYSNCFGHTLQGLQEHVTTRTELPEAEKRNAMRNPNGLNVLTYFNQTDTDIGLPCQTEHLRREFKATLWETSEIDPVQFSVQDEIFPILDLLSLHKKMYERMCTFLALRPPPQSFPVRIEYPANWVFNVQVTIRDFKKFTQDGLFDPKLWDGQSTPSVTGQSQQEP